jgi:hypothetical protein
MSSAGDISQSSSSQETLPIMRMAGTAGSVEGATLLTSAMTVFGSIRGAETASPASSVQVSRMARGMAGERSLPVSRLVIGPMAAAMGADLYSGMAPTVSRVKAGILPAGTIDTADAGSTALVDRAYESMTQHVSGTTSMLVFHGLAGDDGGHAPPGIQSSSG